MCVCVYVCVWVCMYVGVCIYVYVDGSAYYIRKPADIYMQYYRISMETFYN